MLPLTITIPPRQGTTSTITLRQPSRIATSRSAIHSSSPKCLWITRRTVIEEGPLLRQWEQVPLPLNSSHQPASSRQNSYKIAVYHRLRIAVKAVLTTYSLIWRPLQMPQLLCCHRLPQVWRKQTQLLITLCKSNSSSYKRVRAALPRTSHRQLNNNNNRQARSISHLLSQKRLKLSKGALLWVKRQ